MPLSKRRSEKEKLQQDKNVNCVGLCIQVCMTVARLAVKLRRWVCLPAVHEQNDQHEVRHASLEMGSV